MALNMHTMIQVLFLVLCSGILLFSLAANRLRRFNPSESKLNWTEAGNKCIGEGGSLLSLNDEEDVSMIHRFLENTSEIRKVWLGLEQKNTSIPTWSNGDKFIFDESTTEKQGKQLCEAIQNGTWKGFNCSEKKAFMCQKGNNYSLVAIEKNWCQAMQHCKTHYTNLASINDAQQNEELRNKSEGKSFWIGLQYDKFQWMDNSCSTFSYVEGSEPKCFVVNVDQKGQWNTVPCRNDETTICYKGNVKIRLIEEPKTWEEALNYCTAKHSRFLWIKDQEDQYAVAQWLNFTYTGSNPLWIGLKQSSVFGFWIWSDRIVNYNKWENGQQPEMPLSNQCGVINAETHTWSDENCWSQLPFLCEEDIIYM
ncbi:secretory phospholipase A2 receptor-like [Girardinichthys multiradiatus]|uniref:secretory phospholipase A2 receptor-like n=1 Tax=Girardinichthys multiradiatus TaxID=208333 RepID=UPI001FAE2C19|nr:secretory phospholipase A2 receptor-like [Girardinichthys multiradiatus]